MGLFRTEESKRNWKRLIWWYIIITAILTLIGYFFVIPAFLSWLGFIPNLIFQESFFHIVIIFIDVVFSFIIAAFLVHLLIILKYINKPMLVTKKDKGFTIKKSEEAGRRQKGQSRSMKKKPEKPAEEKE